MKKNCQHCNKEFTKLTRTGIRHWFKRKFCSRGCYHLNMVGVPHGHKTANGIIAWNKGLKLPQFSGESHFMWKGEKVSYRSLHKWVERHMGKPNKCSDCGKVAYGRSIHWANKSGDYRRDLSDWLRLCSTCHGVFDKSHGFRGRNKTLTQPI